MGGDGGVVGVGYGVDDGQSQAVVVSGSGSVMPESLEGLEDQFGLGGGT